MTEIESYKIALGTLEVHAGERLRCASYKSDTCRCAVGVLLGVYGLDEFLPRWNTAIRFLYPTPNFLVPPPDPNDKGAKPLQGFPVNDPRVAQFIETFPLEVINQIQRWNDEYLKFNNTDEACESRYNEVISLIKSKI